MKASARTLVPLVVLAGVMLVFRTVAAGPVKPTPLGQTPQTEVSIVMSNPAVHPKVGLPDFQVTPGDPELDAAAKTIADVLWDDINYEREFYMIQRKASASIPIAAANALPFDRWTAIGADFVLVGALSRRGTDLSVELRMISVKASTQGQQSWSKGYPNCKPLYLRLCAHSIADDFHKDTRALDGVARTKLAFASDRQGARATGRPSQTLAASKEIYISDYDGANQTRVTVNGNLNCCPAWSPSGGMLSYVS